MKKIIFLTLIFVLLSLIVRGAPPQVQDIILSSSSGNNITDDNLTVSYNITDSDGNITKPIFDWLKNNQSIYVINLPFEGGSNSTYTKEYSSYGTDGIVRGAVWNSTGGVDGFGAYYFNGSVDIAVGAIGYIESSYSVMVWVKRLNDTGDYECIFCDGSAHYLDTYAGTLRMFSSTLSDSSISCGGVISDDIWIHVAFTYSNGTKRLYVNGIECANETNITGNMTVNNLAVGRQGFSGTRYWVGYIDNVQSYNIGLTPEQIMNNYNGYYNTIISQETKLNDTWQTCVTPNDGGEDGIEQCSNELTIRTPVIPPTPVEPDSTGIESYLIYILSAFGVVVVLLGAIMVVSMFYFGVKDITVVISTVGILAVGTAVLMAIMVIIVKLVS